MASDPALRERRQTRRQGREQRRDAYWATRQRGGEGGDPSGEAAVRWDQIRLQISRMRGGERRDRAWRRLREVLGRFDPEQ